MSSATSGNRVAEWTITVFLLAMMAGAYVLTLRWPENAALFPRMVSAAGLILIVVRIVFLLRQGFAPPAAPAPVAAKSKVIAVPEDGEKSIEISGPDSDEQGDESELHDVFASAGGRRWLSVIGWIAAFFIGLHLFGLLVALPVFTVFYLRVVAKASWLTCFLYVLGTAGLIYLLFVAVLHLPLPEGIIPILPSR
ncbi:MAG: tripartite tricarboxylate transporter TctB family protein [Pseudomonadota bacterium]|nr:tripartite tricarboxylate transporter TctB family protein [Pseudomonadota bacterium]MDQ2704774.1 tripartite tricarboxylate transporter TctB family protein [Pseudomonadota bacterium]